MSHDPPHWRRNQGLAAWCAAALAVWVLGAATVGKAAGPTAGKTEEQQIQALQRQLQTVEARLQQLAEQNEALLQHQQQIERQLAQQAAAVPAQSIPAAPGQSASPAANTSALPGQTSTVPGQISALPSATTALDNLRLWGYGELYYSRPTRDTGRTSADLARAVFGIGYRFDNRTEFNSEYELEHAVTSASDRGEFEVEQFYVDRQLADRTAARAGLFLLPFGFINEHHEPTQFYGMQRNFVETLIIPSTWREGGVSFHGDADIGIAWSAGVTTGVNLANWDFAPKFPRFTTALELANNTPAPLQATHQELALANARHLSQYMAVNYFGLPGLDVGGAVFTGNAKQAPGTVGDSRVTLWEGHARWTPGKFDLSAVYAHGAISNVAAANRANPGSPNPIPSAFYGYFVQAAYGAWEHGDYRLNPFVRWEYFDMGSEYSGTVPQIPTGTVPFSGSPADFAVWPQNRDRVWTTGVNFYVTPHVVFKADYQWFDINRAFNRLDLGLGLNF